jgi:hypothetical protein
MVKIADLVEDFRRADIGGRRATVRFTDEDRVEVDIMLDGAEGREGLATPIAVYARYDAETGELLSLDMVPYYRPPATEA